jgi:hypothetical protein
MALSEQQVQDLLNKGLDLEQVNKYERALFLLHNLSNTLTIEYSEYMKNYGVRGKTSHLAKKANNSTEELLHHIRQVVPSSQTLNFFEDYEHLEKTLREFFKI